MALAFSTAPILAAALLTPSAMAQLTTADILGTVTDATGAVIPNATVVLTNVETHDQRTATSNGSGDYQFTLLPVGRYTVTTKSSGFKTATTNNLAVEAGDRARADVHLETGGEEQTVNVEAQTPLLQADNATVSSTVTAKAVQDLPLNGRNFVQLVQIVPGANEGPGNGLVSGGRPDDRRASASFSVNGQDDTLNNFIIDGTDDNERVIGTIGVRPNVEGIQEITVETNSYSAEAGRTAGGVVSIITRSGTNQFHGSAYEFFRNDIFDARNVLQGTGRKPELRQNQFGGSIGGPIFKDRTFFFADYEGLRLVSGVTYTSSVPQIAQYNQINSIGGGTPQQLIAQGNGTQTYALDPIALAYLKLFPAPTNAGVTNNYVVSPSKTQTSNTFDARVDHKFNGNNNLFARYTYNKVDTNTPQALGTQNGLAISGGRYIFAGPATDKAMQYGLGYTHIFSQNLLVDLRAAYTRINNLSLPLNNGTAPDTKLGFGSNMNFNNLSSFLTPIQFGGFSDIGDGAYVPLQDIDNTFQYSGSVSYTKGNHNLKFGAGLIRRQARNVQSAFAAGQYTFGLSTDNVASTTQTQINQLASSLVGAFTGESRNYDLNPPDYRSWEPSFFALDSWKVNPKLTVLYGVRYDVFTPFTEAHNRISNFDFTQASGSTAATVGSALKVAGVNGVDGHAGIKTDYSNFAPRVGFSLSVNPKTVVRGGYGLSFFPGNYTSNADLKNAPFVSVYSPNCSQALTALRIQTNTTAAGTPGTTANPTAAASFNNHCFTPGTTTISPTYDGTSNFAAGLPLPAAQTLNSNSLSFVAENPNFRSALIQQFNLQVEEQFGSNVFTVGYVGNLGQHLAQTINNINSPAPFNPLTAPASAQNLRLQTQLPNLGGVGWLSSGGYSNYNSLQTSFQRRFTKGLAFDANYTYAKALSTNTGFSQEGNQGWSNGDPTRINAIDYGVAENDIEHRFALSVNYELQYGKNFTGLKRLALGGWQANTILVWQSGKPFSILNGGQNDFTLLPSGAAGSVYGNRATPINGGGSDRPNKIGNAKGPKTLTQYFNTANYAPQPLGTIGTAQRNSEFGPHFRHIDLSIFKDFHITERVNLEFRAEAFDLTNTPDYYIGNNNVANAQLGSSTFGQVTNYDPNYNPRQLQFALKAQF
ncbi:TonB-dependent receptor [Granulicella tundricola]|uniref:TonB-dependent receptor plug n=1 Tax=Granulicella tundricola (strain ATCC BAA-1859 / DSM 23138 / MP5ACTX9) TaxID=1198114 RepID=E8X6A2_GRATM|nr:TonB-dependent receptor [Granulicella tundricola]ADW70986.1 TonB-dependent receptor plug [Granulicella tundricola MP5ACTX9]